MIRITRETDYGIILLCLMAREAGQSFSAATLAQRRGLPLPMVSKILKNLTRGGILQSQRGAQGGYRLARPPQVISVADIIDTLEGPIALTECSPGAAGECLHQDRCTVSGHWTRINRAVREALEQVTLWEMSFPSHPAGPARPLAPVKQARGL